MTKLKIEHLIVISTTASWAQTCRFSRINALTCATKSRARTRWWFTGWLVCSTPKRIRYCPRSTPNSGGCPKRKQLRWQVSTISKTWSTTFTIAFRTWSNQNRIDIGLWMSGFAFKVDLILSICKHLLPKTIIGTFKYIF